MTDKCYKRIVLHAGLHKTGTSSIQENCFKHREWLRLRGIVYTSFKFEDRELVNHSDPLASMASKPGKYGLLRRLKIEQTPGKATRLFSRQWEQLFEHPEGDTLVLSAEHVGQFNEKDMEALRRYLESHSQTLEVIAYIRSPQSSLESILQQQSASNVRSPEPESLIGLVKQRYQRIHGTFSDLLQTVNFHQAVEHPTGLVGSFFCLLGLPPEDVSKLQFNYANERMSMEAFKLMDAINRTYPMGFRETHGIPRSYNDMSPLYSLPGQPFQCEGILDPALNRSLEEEGQWLEQELGFSFPAVNRKAPAKLWQPQTLSALKLAINRIDNAECRGVAKKTLNDESITLEQSDPGTAAVLRFIAGSISEGDELSTELILEKLGADYFKFSALQVESASAEMSLLLMLLARQLRSDAPFIEERIRHYQALLEQS